MKKNQLDPSGLPRPFGNYSHGIEVIEASRLIRTSGQLSISQDGYIPVSAFDQAVMIFDNLNTILSDGNMTPDSIIHIGAYVTDRTYMADYMKARDQFLEPTSSPPPASTLLIVSGFTKPEFKVEIEITAVN